MSSVCSSPLPVSLPICLIASMLTLRGFSSSVLLVYARNKGGDEKLLV